MNLITIVGGVLGILLGAAVIGVVVGVGLLPLVFIHHSHELTEPDEETRRETRERMSVHV
jgi:hypothetical protein